MANNLNSNWNYPTKMIFGAGVLSQLSEICHDLGMNKPLLVTDEGLATSDIVKSALDISGAGLFSGVKGNPTGTNVDDGVKFYKAGGYDGIIAFGGGSGLDAAKAIALMVGQNRPLWDFEDIGDNWTRVNVGGMAPVVAVPTTSGTGSEVGRASVITNEQSHEKKIIFHANMLPAVVLADPELTIGLPAHLTAATGVDAFVHCFEAFSSTYYHPMADGIAIEGMRLIARYLPKAYADGGDIEARSHMLVASSMGATAFQKGLGAVHALAHPLGAVYDKHHGLLNAIILPYVMVKNRQAIEEKMVYLARALDLDDYSFDAVLTWVLDLRKQLNIVHTLAEIDINADRADEIGQMASCDPSAGGNPIAFTKEDYTELFRNAIAGKLNDYAKVA